MTAPANRNPDEIAQKQITPVLNMVYNPSSGQIEPQAPSSGGGSASPSQLPIKSQTSLPGTGASLSLPTAPTGTTYALIQIKNQTLWFRLDATAAVTSGAIEQFIDPGGTLELTSAAEITAFRGIQVSGGVLSITYRGA